MKYVALSSVVVFFALGLFLLKREYSLNRTLIITEKQLTLKVQRVNEDLRSAQQAEMHVRNSLDDAAAEKGELLAQLAEAKKLLNSLNHTSIITGKQLTMEVQRVNESLRSAQEAEMHVRNSLDQAAAEKGELLAQLAAAQKLVRMLKDEDRELRENQEALTMGRRFPWPPPKATSRWSIPQASLLGSESLKTLNDYDWLLCAVLRQAQYSELAYYQITNGFVLVNPIEEVTSDGHPLRRISESCPEINFSLRGLKQYIRLLLGPSIARSRIIAFAVTDVPCTDSEDPPSYNHASNWIQKGLNVLPEIVGTNSVTEKCTLSVFIYEFNKAAPDGQVEFLETSTTSPQIQLEHSGIRLPIKPK